MEADTILSIAQAISQVGFPIVCCILLWRFISTKMEANTAAMQANTRAIERLCDRLGVQNTHE